MSAITTQGVTGSAAGGSYSTELDLLSFVKALQAGSFPGADGGIGIAGGAPGTSAVVESNGEWTVVVLTNFEGSPDRIAVIMSAAVAPFNARLWCAELTTPRHSSRRGDRGHHRRCRVAPGRKPTRTRQDAPADRSRASHFHAFR